MEIVVRPQNRALLVTKINWFLGSSVNLKNQSRKEEVEIWNANHDYTGIQPILEEIYGMWLNSKSFCNDEAWDAFLVVMDELEVLNASFDVFAPVAGFLVHPWWDRRIPDTLADFRAALRKATKGLRRASKKRIERRAKDLSRAVANFEDTIALWRPQFKGVFEKILECLGCGIRWTDLNQWKKIFNLAFTEMSINFLCRKECFPPRIKLYLEAILTIRSALDLFLCHILPTSFYHNRECEELLNHIGCVIVRTACSLYSWSIDEMGQNLGQQETMSIDLLKGLMPTTPKAVNIFVKVLKASKTFKSWESNNAAIYFVDFLIPAETKGKGSALSPQGLQTFQKGLAGLISFLIDPPKITFDKGTDMQKQLLSDITATVCDFGSLSHFIYVNEEMTDLVRFKLLDKVELLNVEVLFFELEKLLNIEPNPKLLMDTESVDLLTRQKALLMKVTVQDRIDSLHEGLSLLRVFLAVTHQFEQFKNIEYMKSLWMHVEDLIRDAHCVYNSFCSGSITPFLATNEIHDLHGKTNLLKIEAFFMELLDSPPCWVVAVKAQIEILHEGLVCIRTFLMSPLEVVGKLILPRVKALAVDAEYLYCSLQEREDPVEHLNLFLPDLLEKIELIKTEISESYKNVRRSFQSNFPINNGLGYVCFLLENLQELLNMNVPIIASVKHHIKTVQKEMEEILKSFPWDVAEHHDEESDLKILASDINNAAYQAEYLIDSFVVKGGNVWYHVLWLSDLIKEIKFIKVRVLEISKKKFDVCDYKVGQLSRNVISHLGAPSINEFVVDLHDQSKPIIDGLIAGSSRRDVISIVGMPGLGKTTLAQRIYNDPSVTYHFHIRSWGCVSQGYQKRKLLLDLLSNLIELTDDIHEMTDDDLDFKLYQCLKQRRYLIVLDDFWSIEPWNDLEASLPDDNNGSRLLITSRLSDVTLKTRPVSVPHHLRLLSDDESWQLLLKKLFQSQDCPDELVEVGKQIARSCKGLPLAIVAISGLLQRTKKTQDWWNQVAERISAHIADDAETRCMDILEMSYKHLPNHLRPCFLYIGAFLADQEIPVWKLKCLWIAEGFIRKMGTKSLDDGAEEYLKDLIGRSLIMACRKSSNGGAKTCRLHDMLRTMCLVRCKEENFLQRVNGYDEHFASSFEDLDYGVDSRYSYPSGSSVTYDAVRLSICSKRNHFVMLRPCGKHVRSLLFFASTDTYPRCPYNISFIPPNFKLLRVLDLESINMGNSFPSDVEFLVHLRYLAVCGDIDSIPASIARLWNLETLIVKGLKGEVVVPIEIWSMKKLRHLQVINHAALSLQDYNLILYHLQMDNLVRLSTPYLYGKDTEEIMRKLLKLRKLGCVFAQSRDDEFPVLDFLTELESLKICYSGRIAHPRNFKLPMNLKKLTLSRFRLPWDHISKIGKLPNLETLKLLSKSFEGKIWDMKEGEFLKLRFLKLDTLNIAQWNASSDTLPQLQRLVVQNCRQLEMVPSEIGEICTLEMIEMQFCRPSAEESVHEIKEQQLEMGNKEFKVFINGSNWNFNV